MCNVTPVMRLGVTDTLTGSLAQLMPKAARSHDPTSHNTDVTIASLYDTIQPCLEDLKLCFCQVISSLIVFRFKEDSVLFKTMIYF